MKTQDPVEMKQAPKFSTLGTVIRWIHPMFWAALGAHALVLFIPLSSEQSISVPEAEETETITVSRAPTVTKSGSKNSDSAQTDGTSRQSTSSQSSTSGSGAAGTGRRLAADSGSGSRTGGSGSGGPESSGGSDDRNVEEELADLSTESNSDSTPDTDTTNAPSTDVNGETSNGTDPLLAYAEEIRSRDERTISDILYNSFRALNLAYTPIPVLEEEAIEKEIEAWVSTIRTQTNRRSLSPEEVAAPITVNYEAVSCLRPEPAAATVGVLVDENGDVIPLVMNEDNRPPTVGSEIIALLEDLNETLPEEAKIRVPDAAKLIKSTGYTGLDGKAIAAVIEQDFEPSDDIKAYLYQVEVSYDPGQCVSLPLQSRDSD
ncbi:MAG: hypothetical protein AAGF66_01065 [Cyanobacteria bacterium P01_H01_bin.119]